MEPESSLPCSQEPATDVLSWVTCHPRLGVATGFRLDNIILPLLYVSWIRSSELTSESLNLFSYSLDEGSPHRKASAYAVRRNTEKLGYPCFERDSNPRSQCSSGTRHTHSICCNKFVHILCYFICMLAPKLFAIRCTRILKTSLLTCN
jgi:hypothetical protein